jgi:hemoglobin
MEKQLNDIGTREDIELLIDAFYKKVVADDLIGVFFTQVVVLDWAMHIPVLYDFWESNLLGSMRYKGNPMSKHFELDGKKAMNAAHFDRWLLLWETTVNHLFKGTKADEAIQRAKQIAQLMLFKIEQHRGM